MQKNGNNRRQITVVCCWKGGVLPPRPRRKPTCGLSLGGFRNDVVEDLLDHLRVLDAGDDAQLFPSRATVFLRKADSHSRRVKDRWPKADVRVTVASLVTLSRPRLFALVPEYCYGPLYCGEVGQMSELEEWHA